MLMEKKKSQGSVEFLILTAVLLAFFLFVFLIFSLKLIDVSKIRNEDMAEDLYNIVNTEVILAKGNLEGYSREFILPETMNGLNYTVEFINVTNATELRVTVEEYEEYFVLAEQVSGTVIKGNNSVNNYNRTITFTPLQD